MKQKVLRILCNKNKQNTVSRITYSFSRSVKEAVDFVLFGARTFIDWLPGKEAYLRGKWFLEVGPGQEFGLPILLMGFGAKVVLVDRYMCQWDKKFHLAFYKLLRSETEKKFPGIDLQPITKIIETESHDIDNLLLIRTGLEDLAFFRSGIIDVSYSNATFEHLSNIAEAIYQLGRITKVGGVGFHQVDFRDHRSFKTPLDHLTLTESELDNLNIKEHNKIGTGVRPAEFTRLFLKAGFRTEFEPNDYLKDQEYFSNLKSRIDPRFESVSDEELKILSGRYRIIKE